MVSDGYSYDNDDPRKSFRTLCTNVPGCKIEPIIDVCQPLFERLGLGVKPGEESTWGRKRPDLSKQKEWVSTVIYVQSVNNQDIMKHFRMPLLILLA